MFNSHPVGEGDAGAQFVLVTAGQPMDSSSLLGRSRAWGNCCATAAGSVALGVYLSNRTDFYGVFKTYQI